MPPHDRDKGFRNLHIKPQRKGLVSFLRMRFFAGQWPDYAAGAGPVARVAAALDKIHAPGNGLQTTWIGHATVLVQVGGINILTDPVFSERASPLSFYGPKRAAPPALTLAQLPLIHLILISHDHYDHLDERAARRLGERPVWVTPLGYRRTLARFGVQHVVECDWWQRWQLQGAVITATPSQHWRPWPSRPLPRPVGLMGGPGRRFQVLVCRRYRV